MDRNMRYINSGTRSLPHMGKRHNGHNGARLSPPAQTLPHPHPHHNHNHNHNHNSHNHSHSHSHSHNHNHNSHNNSHSHHDDLINYVYDSWNQVSRELERGSEDAKYYQEVVAPRQLANFRPFNLDEWWGRRLLRSINQNKNRS